MDQQSFGIGYTCTSCLDLDMGLALECVCMQFMHAHIHACITAHTHIPSKLYMYAYLHVCMLCLASFLAVVLFCIIDECCLQSWSQDAGFVINEGNYE